MLPTRGRKGARTGAAGFTLMEVLVAFFVFGLVVSLLFGSYTGILRNVEGTTDVVDRLAGVKNCMDRIQLDLDSVRVKPKGLYEPPEFDGPPDPWRFEGRTENVGGMDFARLRFVSEAHVDLAGTGKTGGIAEIMYYVTADPAGDGYVLRRRDVVFAPLFEEEDALEETGADPILLEDVRGLSFRFLDGEDEWRAEWDSDSEYFRYQTPKAVAVMLEVGPPETRQGEGTRYETAVRLPLVREPKE